MPSPRLSSLVEATDDPPIGMMQGIAAGNPSALSLAQGVVRWGPPPEAVAAAREAASNPATFGYGPDDGDPEFKAALVAKLESENGLPGHDVLVTPGSNAAFVAATLALLDPADASVLFAPYYFNHMMALQMRVGVEGISVGPSERGVPDLGWLEAELERRNGPARGAGYAAGDRAPSPSPPSPPPPSAPRRIAMVTVVNPGNPTGRVLPREWLDRAVALTAAHGAWLFLDSAYEGFVYDPALSVHTPSAPHVVHAFSFSKSHGMMGWRVGYLAYRREQEGLRDALMKVQDTCTICCNRVAQRAALAALSAGRAWADARVEELSGNRVRLREALAPLGPGAVVGDGAIYLWARLPGGGGRGPGDETPDLPPSARSPAPALARADADAADDVAVARWLVEKHGVVCVPGSAAGARGHVRLTFASLSDEDFAVAAARLEAGIRELVERGGDVAADLARPRGAAAGEEVA